MPLKRRTGRAASRGRKSFLLDCVQIEVSRSMGFVDIHSHILPGIDDGAGSMEQALEMLRIAQSEGITDIIATPHYKSGRYKADSREVSRLLEKLQRAAEEESIAVRLYPGTEIYYHSELEERLDSGNLHTMNYTDFVLVEFSPFEDYGYIRNAAEDILSMGFVPVMAHVERYQCLLKDEERVQELKDMGCCIQVNASGIVGDYGLAAKRFTRKLLKKQLVDYVGTDAHNTDKRKPAMQKCADILYKKCSREYADAVLYENSRHDLLEEEL